MVNHISETTCDVISIIGRFSKDNVLQRDNELRNGRTANLALEVGLVFFQTLTRSNLTLCCLGQIYLIFPRKCWRLANCGRTKAVQPNRPRNPPPARVKTFLKKWSLIKAQQFRERKEEGKRSPLDVLAYLNLESCATNTVPGAKHGIVLDVLTLQ